MFEPTDKELACRRLEALRQKVARLNTKAGKAINAPKPYFTNTVRAIDRSQVDTWAAARSKTAATEPANIVPLAAGM